MATASAVRARLFQISWHADELGRNHPLNGCDHHPTLPIFATCSNDQKVNLWKVVRKAPAALAGSVDGAAAAAVVSTAAPPASGDDVEFEFMYALSCHVRSVNAVRFSPNGECTA